MSRETVYSPGMTFGSWEIVRRVENFGGNSDYRVQWLVRCLNCQNEFKMVSRNIHRRLNPPTGCKQCRPPKVPKTSGEATKTIMGFSIELIEKINAAKKS
jgi:hypothetical protein